MVNFWSDIGHVIRALRRAPTFSLAVIALLTAGVALSVLAFAVVRGYLIRPLPYPDAARVVQILTDASRTFANVPRGLDAIPVEDLRDVFVEVAQWDLDGFTVLGGDQAEFVDGAWVNPGFFSIVGARPYLGRLISQEDVRTGARVAVISYGYWQRRFGGKREIINATFRAYSTDRPSSGEVFTVIGVLPPDFWHINPFTDILSPLMTPRMPSLARLSPGVTVASASERLTAIARATVGDAAPEWRMGLVPVQQEYLLQIRPTLFILLGAVASVLLVACANVAGLLMVRGVLKEREFAIRAALGASRARIMRLQVAEALVLGGAAAILSIWVIFVCIDILANWLETQIGVRIPRGAGSVRLDWALTAITVAAAIVSGLVAALRPALIAIAASRGGRLGSLVRGPVAHHGRFRASLVVGQVAVSFVLLAGLGLMVQTLFAMQNTPLGFDPGGVLKGHVLLPQPRYPDALARRAVVREVLQQVRTIPNVEAVATVMPHPFRFQGNQPVVGEGASAGVRAVHHVVAGDYWRTMKITITAGRVFDSGDRGDSQLVAIISGSVAQQLWPEESAIGRRIRTSTAPDAPWRVVVGVVDDVRKTFAETVVGDTYVPYEQSPGGYFALMVRTGSDVGFLAQPVQQRLSQIAPDLPLHEVEPLAEVVRRQSRQQRFLAALLTGFSAITSAAALVGLYAVLTFGVALRSREIAIRVAVGAGQWEIAGSVAREGAVLIGTGLVLGVVMSDAVARLMSSQLVGTWRPDWITYAGAALLFGVVSTIAILAPARRAMRLDPVEALRIQ